MAFETILIKDAAGDSKPVVADLVGGDYVQVQKLGYGADGALVGLDEKPAVASAQETANEALGTPADAEAASGDGTIVALLKRLRTLLAGTLSIGGTVAVSNFPSTTDVTGSTVAVANFPATQPVSGPLTDAQLRAASVPVSGPLTDAQLRATPVAVEADALPLPAGASPEATLAALNAKLAALSNGRVPVVDAAYDAVFGKMLVGTARDKFRDEFATFDTANNWEVVQTGAGMTVTTAGAANGARYLNIATGVTINSETIIQSRATFKLPVKLACALSMSQRIANQEAFVELVGVDGAGAVETDTSIAASANLNNATNAAALKWDGTTAANALSIVRGYGISELAQASSAYVTTLATGTGPNFIPAGIFEINADMEEVVFGARSIDSVAAMAGVNKRTQYIVDPTKDYKVRIRVRNLGTAPASTTDVRIHNVRVLDTTRFTVDWARHMGRAADIADSLPVAITTAATVPVSLATNTPTLAAGTNRAAFFAAAGIWYDDSSTALGANASFTGTSRDATVTATATAFANAATYAQEIVLSAESDVTGTLWLEVSRDNTNWRRVKSVATAAVTGGGFYAEIVHRPSWRYWRAGYTNGAGAQTRFALGSIAKAA